MLIGLGVILAIDLVILGMFLRWAYVEHANVTESMLYGQLLYSSVDGSLMEIWGYLKELTIIGLALYALCVWPANINHAVGDIAVDGNRLPWAYHGPRLVLQPVIIWWALWAGGVTDWPFKRKSN